MPDDSTPGAFSNNPNETPVVGSNPFPLPPGTQKQPVLPPPGEGAPASDRPNPAALDSARGTASSSTSAEPVTGLPGNPPPNHNVAPGPAASRAKGAAATNELLDPNSLMARVKGQSTKPPPPGHEEVEPDEPPLCGRRTKVCRECTHRYVGKDNANSEYHLWTCPALICEKCTNEVQWWKVGMKESDAYPAAVAAYDNTGAGLWDGLRPEGYEVLHKLQEQSVGSLWCRTCWEKRLPNELRICGEPRPCQNPVQIAGRPCNLHGGGSVYGYALPQTKTGRYSEYINPGRAREQFDAIRNSKDILHLLDEVALVRQWILEGMGKTVEGGLTRRALDQMQEAMDAHDRAIEENDGEALARSLGVLKRMIRNGATQEQIRSEMRVNIELLAYLVRQQSSHMVNERMMMDPMAAMANLNLVLNALRGGLKGLFNDPKLTGIMMVSNEEVEASYEEGMRTALREELAALGLPPEHPQAIAFSDRIVSKVNGHVEMQPWRARPPLSSWLSHREQTFLSFVAQQLRAGAGTGGERTLTAEQD